MKSIVQHCWYVAAERRAAAERDYRNVAEERRFRGGIVKHHGIKKGRLDSVSNSFFAGTRSDVSDRIP